MSEKASSSDESTISISHPALANPAVRRGIRIFSPALSFFAELILWVLWVPLAIIRILREPIIITALGLLTIIWFGIYLLPLTAHITGYNRTNLALYFALFPLSYLYIPVPTFIDLPAANSLQDLHEGLRALNSAVASLNGSADARCILDHAATFASTPSEERPDYALYTSGGRVLKGLTSPGNVDQSQDESAWKRAKPSESLFPWPNGAAMAIHYETQPGYCWPLKGSHGTLGVRLARRVFVQEVTVDNVAAQLVWDRSPAPRHMELWGQVDHPDDLEMVKAWEGRHAQAIGSVSSDGQSLAEQRHLFKVGKFVRLSSFEFDLYSSASAQTFPVYPHILDLPVRFVTVMLVILDNWGKEEYTCLYRLRVHGSLDWQSQAGER